MASGEDRIAEVRIDDEGRLRVRPQTVDLPDIFRSGMEVHWDPSTRTLYTPKPREWTYPKWFHHLVHAALDECGVRLVLSTETRWLNVPEEVRREIEGS